MSSTDREKGREVTPMNEIEEAIAWLESRPDFTEGDVATALKLRNLLTELKTINGLLHRNRDTEAMTRFDAIVGHN